jgi:5-methylcytosine-specific restriction endonuclease McrA
MKRALLLNTDWTPLNFVTDVRAFKLLFSGRAEVVSMGEKLSLWSETVNTPTSIYSVPATMRTIERVYRKVPPPRFKKIIMFTRDGWVCQYCSTDLDWSNVSIDHVVPKCRGGQTSWRNCVTACKKCNEKKGAKMLTDLSMRLKRSPTDPRISHFWESHMPGSWHSDWDIFFGNRR